MKTKIKIAVIAMMGIGLTAKAQWSPNGSNTTKGVLTLDGSYINLNVPVTTGGWARGFNNVATDKSTRLGGIGLFGSKENAIYYYLAHGTSPWSSGLGLYVKTNGNVGIGTTSPSEKLDVNGNLTIKGDLKMSGSDSYIWTNGTGTGYTGIWDQKNSRVLLYTSERDGNVGIGTRSPSEKLEVNGNLLVNVFDKGSESGIFFRRGFSATNKYNMSILSYDHNNSGHSDGLSINAYDGVSFTTGSGSRNERMRITQEGNVGIGTDNPSSELEIKSKLNNNAEIHINSSTDGTPSIIRFQDADINTWGLLSNYPKVDKFSIYNYQKRENAIVIDKESNVGIGTYDPKEKLEIDGSVIIKNGHNLSWGNKYGEGIPTIAANVTSGIHFYPNGSTLGATMQIYKDGKTRFTNNVAVLGKLESKEIKVTKTPTADFVFEADYKLPSLEAIEKHIKEKKHLPEIASAKEMEKNGVNVGNFQIQLLQKIEELTLYTIDQDKEIKALKNENKLLKSLLERVSKLEKEIKQLK
ncbi:exported protein of unknown function [Tenacibaculum sp. 190524A02b]|uniref:hypothetical protein n=1 Tax=Tenacibaculum vairaonense TaxID=3137860 RepID=UPI0032B1BAE7